MLRYILYALVALGAALFFPTSRAWLAENTKPAIDPIRVQITKHEMRKIGGQLLSYEVTFRSLPNSARAFDSWLDQRVSIEGERTDSWGMRYRLRVTADSFFVQSSGPDGEVGGADDLEVGRKRDDPWR